MIELAESERSIVKKLAKKIFSSGTEIWAYGSRVDGTCHDASDLDLVVHAPKILSDSDALDELMRFREALTESVIPILVDVFLWSQLPKHFHDRILKCYEVFELN